MLSVKEDLCDGIGKLLDEVLCDQKDSKGVNRSYIYCATVLLEKLQEIISHQEEVNGVETEHKEKSHQEQFKKLTKKLRESSKGGIIRD